MNKKIKGRLLLIFVLTALCVWQLVPIKKALNLGLDLQGGTYLILEVDTTKASEDQKKDAADRVLEIIRNRIDEFGVAEASVQKGTGDRIVIQIPGIGTEGAERIKNIIKKQAHLEFRLVVDDKGLLEKALAKEVSPEFFTDYEVLYEEKIDEMKKKTSIPLLVTKQAYLSGDMLSDARVDFVGGFNEISVSLKFNKKGERRFAKVTEENVNKRLAIVLDNKIQSAPVIRERILGGNASITGSFSMDEAKDLAISLRAGALPAPVKFLQESTVGPALGADSIRKGISASMWGLVLVILFMVLYYAFSGMVANFALGLNIFFLLAVMSYFHATLTVPGIAGIILTIGMAVDANVLVFERIREEMRHGKESRPAIAAGYSKAFWTIFDSNITTIITAIALMQCGSGPIKGFAITLIIGLVVSMFTSLYVTRVIFDIYTDVFKIKKLSI